MKKDNNQALSLGKMPPQSIELEEIVLGSILLEKECLIAIESIFQPDMFYKEQNKIIAEAIVQLRREFAPIDIMTVFEQVRKMGKIEQIGGAYYITTLTNRVASTAHIESHARILHEYYIKRNVIAEASKIMGNAYDDTIPCFDIISQTEKFAADVSYQIVSEKIDDSKTIYRKFLEQNQRIVQNKNGISGVRSGFIDLDKNTGGWQNSDLIILAARPSMGKTALALSFARNASVQFDNATLIFSLEMSKQQLYARLMAQETDINSNKFTRYGLSEDEIRENDAKCSKLIDANLFIDDTPAISIHELKAKARRMKREKGIKLILIDYLQLITYPQIKDRTQEVSKISSELKSIARELNIPVIALSQLSRSVEQRGGEKIPALSDLRESGAIEQDADIIQFLYRPEYYGITNDGQGNSTAGKAVLITAKHRNGSLFDTMLNFHSKTTKFTDNDPQFSDIKSNVIINPDKFHEASREDDMPF